MAVLSNVAAFPGGNPFQPLGKDSICSEGGSTGRRTDWPCHINIADKVKLLRPSVQLPAGIHGWRGLYGFCGQWQGKASRSESPSEGSEPAALDTTVSSGVFRPELRDF